MMTRSLPPGAALRSERHRRVAEAVRELIAEQGFRLSMESVAARAGCSKQTLYSHYGSKDELLRQVIIDRVQVATSPLANGNGDLHSELIEFAVEHLEHLADPNTVAARQLFFADAHRFADEAGSLFRAATHGLQQQLAAHLRTAMERGWLRPANPDDTAELLLAMISGIDSDRRHFAVAHRDTAAARREWALFAVDNFLRAFASQPIS